MSDLPRSLRSCRYDYEKFGTPYKKGSRYYYSHNSGLQNQYVVSWQGREPCRAPCLGERECQRNACLPACHVRLLGTTVGPTALAR